MNSGAALSRNGPCPCGSGRKYKHCCGRIASDPLAGARDAFRRGDLAAAAAGADAVLGRDARHPEANHLRGLVRYQQGDLVQAASLLGRAAEAAPRNDAVLNDLAAILIGLGRLGPARDALEAAARVNPRNPMAWMNLGNLARGAGRLQEALGLYSRAVDAGPSEPLVRLNHGIALRDAGMPARALGEFGAAIDRAPGFLPALQLYADTLPLLDDRADWPADTAARIAACLAVGTIDPAPLAGPAVALLRSQASFAALWRAAEEGEGPLAAALGAPAGRDALRGPLLRGVLEQMLVADPAFERFITRLRAAALALWEAQRLADDAAWLSSLACQCDRGEYVFDESNWEREAVAALQAVVTALGDLSTPRARTAVALVACYRPLTASDGSGTLANARPAASADERVANLLRVQLVERRAEHEIARAIPAITPIRDATSRAVKEQYEANPYPRWTALPANIAAQPLAQRLGSLFPWLGEAIAAIPTTPEILVAGCGTGMHAALVARSHPAGRVLAVDLSRASLAYGTRRARELGLANLSFAQADVLELGARSERFDLIECAGVLHHLADPVTGFRVLVGLLKPDGFMRVALYSETARRAVVAARELIAAAGYTPTLEGIRACRRAIFALPEAAPARPVMRSLDFYSASGCRDLLFNVCEHRYALPELGHMLSMLGLEFLGFEIADASALARYRASHPDDPHARSLAGWAEFEASAPDTFAAMYQFWVRHRRA